ncbi:MAG TPA: hypothetical protein VK694_01515 [Verrucomicrobiae bacterium]|nr:hypothetical protein [Verrucomicrobiae bacterium]
MTMQKYKRSVLSPLLLVLVLTSLFMSALTVLTPQVATAQATAEECRTSGLTDGNRDDEGNFTGYDDYREQCGCREGLAPNQCGIVSYLQLFINVLSGIVGVVVVIMVAVGGVQYASSKDNPQQTAAAKNRIRDAIMALVIYLFVFAFLQWLVPGGLF